VAKLYTLREGGLSSREGISSERCTCDGLQNNQALGASKLGHVVLQAPLTFAHAVQSLTTHVYPYRRPSCMSISSSLTSTIPISKRLGQAARMTVDAMYSIIINSCSELRCKVSSLACSLCSPLMLLARLFKPN